MIHLVVGKGGDHNCIIASNHLIKCWGKNDYGQLGYGDKISRGTEIKQMGNHLPFIDLGFDFEYQVLQIVAGAAHTCARLDNNKIKCWGINNEGQLGYGDEENRGDEPYEMGNNLTYVNLGTNKTAIYIASGVNHNCVILSPENKIKCWGSGRTFQNGYYRPIDHIFNTSIGNKDHHMGDNLPYVDLGSGRTVLSISLGDYFSCALLDNHKAKCWGYTPGYHFFDQNQHYYYNEFIFGDDLPYIPTPGNSPIDKIYAGFEHAFIRLNSTKKWYGWVKFLPDDEQGINPLGLLFGSSFDSISSGPRTYYFISSSKGLVSTFGNNLHGQLGIESSSNIIYNINLINLGE